ncbi:MAG: anhydro-N-acetylmuramic acid kinase [Cocleimonas sp.]|nr:anhydro-N-acetylmuramic acid kinase [Cocleimonas sp.]
MAENSYYIGLMSGTSLDGVDAVLVDFKTDTPKLVANHSHPIPKKLQTKLIEFTRPDWCGSIANMGTFHQQLGRLFSDAVNKLLKTSNTAPQQVLAIGSHGQTLWHQPTGDFPFSLQLGDANLITELTNITTVADFRSRDIAAGGQGAPLVPAFHHKVLSHNGKSRVILNIGGIANISVLPSKASNKPVMGFDTGPGNGLIDAWIHAHKANNYDKSGDWGRSGAIQDDVLNTLLEDPYFSLPEPKSTGKEFFNLAWLKNTLGNTLEDHKPEDIQATLIDLTAKTIANSIDTSCDELFVCGGGIHNHFLIERLRHHLPDITIASTEKLGIDPDWMEAIAFAWLAKQTMEGKAGNLPSATGAKGPRILGAIYTA